jgi:hypothetical protein
MRFLFIFVTLTIESRNIELLQLILKILSCCAPTLTPVCERCVLTYSHNLMFFFMWSGNHKFYIQFSRLLRLQSFRITLYKLSQLNEPLKKRNNEIITQYFYLTGVTVV